MNEGEAQIQALRKESEMRRKAEFHTWVQQTGKEFKAKRMQVKLGRTENWVMCHNASDAVRRSGKRCFCRMLGSRQHGGLRVGSHRKEKKVST